MAQMESLEPLPQRLRCFLFWGAVSGSVFFAVYPLANWWTAQRSQHLSLWFPFELNIPFQPGWIWVYLSMHALFWTPPGWLNCARLRTLGLQLTAATLVAGLLFLAFPARLGYTRVLPQDPLLHSVYQRVFLLDPPHNLIPSLHVVWSALVAWAVADAAPRPLVGWMLQLWLAAIVASTLLTHQHHLVDLLVGFALVFLTRRLIDGGGGGEREAS